MDENNYLLLELGLYEKVEITPENISLISKYLISGYSKRKQFDSYCVECKKDSTFVIADNISFTISSDYNNQLKILSRLYNLIYRCQRDESHVNVFNFRIYQNFLIKIGQFPSLADLQFPNFEKYRKLLKDDYRDLTKAIGLHSSSIGIGSYVYLRRIFENLVEEAKSNAINDGTLDIERYNRSRMDEKVNLLKSNLPRVLVENRKLYAIISKGLHELSEQECLDMFDPLLLGIELILDDKLAIITRTEKENTLKTFVSNTLDKLK